MLPRDGLPPPLDPSVTKPIVKLLVNQQHVFKTVAEKCDGFDHLECKYCQEKFSSDSQFQDHLSEETHKLRHLYRTNKKSLLNSQYKLTVCVNEDGKSLENVIVRPGTAGSARVNVANCSEEMKMLTDAIPLIIHSKVKVDCPHFPVEIKPEIFIPSCSFGGNWLMSRRRRRCVPTCVGRGWKKVRRDCYSNVSRGGSGESVTDVSENMDFEVVQAVERVVAAACASAEERYKGRLNNQNYVGNALLFDRPPGHGDTLHLSIVYCFEDSGAYMYPVLLKIQSQTSSEPVYVLKELVFRCQSEFVDDLKPISEYKYPIPPKLRVSEGPIIPGVPPSSMKSSLVMVRRLDNYYIPPYLDKVLNNGLKQHPKMSSAEVKKLNEVNLWEGWRVGAPPPPLICLYHSIFQQCALILVQIQRRDKAHPSDPVQLSYVIYCDMLHRLLLGVDDVKEGLKARKCNLSANNYCDLFSLLLHIEEHQMKIDIHTFDCDNQILKAIPGEHNLLALKVPGLAENRPSVLRGDAIYVEILGDNNHLRYEGIVHRVRENDVHLGFHKNFITKYVMGMQLRVQFTFNRLPLRVQHRALSMLRRCEVQKLMFPSIYRGLFGVSPITKWFNRDVSTNQQQMTAVTNIVFESASPAPYIVFGPPGTGKTVTMVEAIVQLWHIKKPHMLVCAPSNSAADVIASRLLEKGHIPASNILRMYAASHEGGHAMEPEVLVPIAGILTTEGHRGTFTGQLVIAGDPKQLGPIIRSTVANKLGLGRSYLERLMDEVDLYSRDEETDTYDTAVITKLIKNFRSHKDILNISNSLFYHKELKTSLGILDPPPLPLSHSGSTGRSVDLSVYNSGRHEVRNSALGITKALTLSCPSGTSCQSPDQLSLVSWIHYYQPLSAVGGYAT
uniref:C2H2-type domain-containing protein n=1 Tax=Timema cristinae TaxID=61476 RepID=A0A7R9D6I6_TIMCR|nr:unnamed protein product [Timema cristinae]